jgi:hypothetical protein
MGDVHSVSRAIVDTGLPFMIGSYSAGKYATQCRIQYYQNCDYRHVSWRRTERGVMFSSAEGLRSFAFNAKFVRSLFPPGYMIMQQFSSIGIAYLHRECEQELARTAGTKV